MLGIQPGLRKSLEFPYPGLCVCQACWDVPCCERILVSSQCRGQEKKFLIKARGWRKVYDLTEPADNLGENSECPRLACQTDTHQILAAVCRAPSLASVKMRRYCPIKKRCPGIPQRGKFRAEHRPSVGVAHLMCVSPSFLLLSDTPAKKKLLQVTITLWEGKVSPLAIPTKELSFTSK